MFSENKRSTSAGMGVHVEQEWMFRLGGNMHTEGAEDFFIFTQSLPLGLKLSVAEETRRAFAINAAILEALLVSGGLAAIICLAIGVWITRKLLRPLDDLAELAAQVSKGNLDARYRQLTQSGSTDIDDIGRSLDAMLERINTLVSGLRRVSRDIAHDLRTPLSVLKQQLEQARHADSLSIAAISIQEANGKVDEVLGIFDAILRLGEIEAGSSRERFTTVCLSDVAEDVTQAYQPSLEELEGELTYDIEPEVAVSGDRQLLAQAIANLIQKAIRHAGPNPHIAVTVSGAVTGSGDTYGPRLRVTDTGPGVPEGSWSEIIKPFARLDSARSQSGTGLGLAIVNAIATLHDAQLEFANLNPGFEVGIRFSRGISLSGRPR